MESKGAVISDCGRYRYKLDRRWDHRLLDMCWIMLNPSKADGTVDDPTIRKCMAFAKAWGYGGIQVVNLSPYRATNPKELKGLSEADLFGKDNAKWILYCVKSSFLTVAAWGANAINLRLPERYTRFMLAEHGLPLHALKLTKSGQPYHPLYLKGDTKPFLWDANAVAAN